MHRMLTGVARFSKIQNMRVIPSFTCRMNAAASHRVASIMNACGRRDHYCETLISLQIHTRIPRYQREKAFFSSSFHSRKFVFCPRKTVVLCGSQLVSELIAQYSVVQQWGALFTEPYAWEQCQHRVEPKLCGIGQRELSRLSVRVNESAHFKAGSMWKQHLSRLQTQCARLTHVTRLRIGGISHCDCHTFRHMHY